MKVCTKCKKRKKHFHKNKNTKDGYAYECKDCMLLRYKKYCKESRLMYYEAPRPRPVRL